MASRVRASTKGQIVLPKQTRDRLNIAAGTELDVIDTAGGVELRPVKAVPPLDIDAAIDRLQTIVDYGGPRRDEADWQRGIQSAIRRKWGRRA